MITVFIKLGKQIITFFKLIKHWIQFFLTLSVKQVYTQPNILFQLSFIKFNF
jgi:hypothetical protein